MLTGSYLLRAPGFPYLRNVVNNSDPFFSQRKFMNANSVGAWRYLRSEKIFNDIYKI